MPQLSAIVPLYNKAPFVLRTLTSMASQSYRDFEVIVVNDGSTDGGDEVARTFSDSRFRVIDQPNAGPGAARNRGLAEARGPLVAFLDADDEWYPEYLQRAVEFLARRPDVAAVSQFYVEAPDRSTEPMWRRRRLMDGTQNMGTLTAELLHYMVAYMTPPATVARTEVLRRWGGFYEQRCTFGEDSF